MIVQHIDLNMIPDSEPVILKVNQYDTGIGRIVAHLYDGDVAYTPASGATAVIQGTKADMHGFQYNATISGSTVTADLSQQMTACAGDVRTQFVITETGGKTGTFVFILKVQESGLQDDTDISDTDLPAIIDLAAANAARAEAAATSAAGSATDAETWASLSPYINENNSHWMVYSSSQHQWVDTGISADGSTTSYNSLENLPQINNTTLQGNKTSSELGLQSELTWDGNYIVL